MSKKKKKNKNKAPDYLSKRIININDETKKSLNKRMNSTLDEIEDYRFQLMELDKKADRKRRKEINKKEREFYQDLTEIKGRRKMVKKWEKTGFLDMLIDLLQQVAPIIRIIAKAVCGLILAFLSFEAIKTHISPKALNKITYVYDLANAI